MELSHKEYLLVPFGSLTDMGYRFVAEMISNQDGEEILGVPAAPDGNVISLSNVGATAKIMRRSNGIWLIDIKILDTVEQKGKRLEKASLPVGEQIRKLFELGYVPKPLFIGKPNKKLNIVMDCKIIGFHMGQPGMLKRTEQSGALE